jgi:ubiquinone/menaquinone biosynthesis C-methylase UbiE
MQSIRRYYNEKSGTYDSQFETLYYKVYDAITWKYTGPYVPTNPQSLVLDAGGGTGRWSVRIAKKGCKVVLVDISDRMLAQAQARIDREKLHDRVIMKKANILDLDYPDETFDLVFCEHTLFLFPDISHVVKELTRVLKKNSTMIISAQNKYTMAMTYLPDDPKKKQWN